MLLLAAAAPGDGVVGGTERDDGDAISTDGVALDDGVTGAAVGAACRSATGDAAVDDADETDDDDDDGTAAALAAADDDAAPPLDELGVDLFDPPTPKNFVKPVIKFDVILVSTEWYDDERCMDDECLYSVGVSVLQLWISANMDYVFQLY